MDGSNTQFMQNAKWRSQLSRELRAHMFNNEITIGLSDGWFLGPKPPIDGDKVMDFKRRYNIKRK